jgi:hypothetical protein
MIKIIVALHNEMIMCNACSPSLWWPMRLCPGDPSPSLHHMNHLDIGNGHHRVVVQSSSKDPLVGVGLLSHLAVIHYWPLPHEMNSGDDDKTANSLNIQRWHNWIWFSQFIY